MTEEKKLNLAHQDLDEVPYDVIRDRRDVRTIDASYNRLRDIQFLANFPQLNSVILDHNRIQSTVMFPVMPQVTVLWMNFNRITQLFPFIKNLQASFPGLKHLSLMGNDIVPPCREETFYDYLQYRLFIISWFKKLEYLDDREVTVDEREEAIRLYSRPFLPTTPSFRFSTMFQNAFEKVRQFLDPGPITGQRYYHTQRPSVI